MCRGPPGVGRKGGGGEESRAALGGQKVSLGKGMGWAEGGEVGRGGVRQRGSVKQRGLGCGGAVGRGNRWAEEASGQREPVAELI